MIAFLTLAYVGVLFLLVKLKVIKLTLWWKLSPVVWILILLIVLFIPMQWGAPSGPVTMYQTVVEVIPNVTGEIVEVPVRALVPVDKDDVLFRIEPRPFQDEVDRLEAALAEAEQAVPQLAAAATAAAAASENASAHRDLAKIEFDIADKTRQSDTGAVSELRFQQARQSLMAAEAAFKQAESTELQASLAYESNIDGVNTRVAQFAAQLDNARYNLEQTTVRAPADGFAIGVTLRPGQRVANLPLSSWMAFVEEDNVRLAAGIDQIMLRHVERGQPAEVTLKLYPGKVFNATVVDLALQTPQGQLTPSGLVPLAPTRNQVPEPYGVILELDESIEDLYPVPGGALGTAAIYTDIVKPTHLIRKVMIRMDAWLNYIIPG